jgi:hypothetical protein
MLGPAPVVPPARPAACTACAAGSTEPPPPPYCLKLGLLVLLCAEVASMHCQLLLLLLKVSAVNAHAGLPQLLFARLADAVRWAVQSLPGVPVCGEEVGSVVTPCSTQHERDTLH